MRFFFLLCCAAVTMLGAPAAAPALNDTSSVPAGDPMFAQAAGELTSASHELSAHFRDVQSRSGMAVDLQTRIDSDLAIVDAPSIPDGWTKAQYASAYADIASLDASLIDQLATGAYHAAHDVRGLDEILVRSPADQTMQPVALYVPQSYSPAKPAPLVVFLHGRGWSEADMLGVPFVREAAERTGAIVAAPLARGDILYADPAPADVYAAVNAVEGALRVDRGRVFLAGHSMGGFGVFQVGIVHPEMWSGFLCVSGSLTESDANAAARALRDKVVYVVSGEHDDEVPFNDARITVQFLRQSDIATRFYDQPDGGHSLATLGTAFNAAWNDMLDGIRSDSGSAANQPSFGQFSTLNTKPPKISPP